MSYVATQIKVYVATQILQIKVVATQILQIKVALCSNSNILQIDRRTRWLTMNNSNPISKTGLGYIQ